MIFSRWKEYDPTWLVKSAEYRFSEYTWLRDALIACNRAKIRSDYYIYFVNEKKPNKPGSEWQFQESITIEDTPEGDVVIDVIQKNKVGGIEFLTRVIDGT
ncbi:hypothetical protein [Saccharophagus degradans]|uniref:hypothetical protein n=1 Tax=Saccharophagus degradans TaxID=86304 RepID=UPI00003C93D4|nr:hypothetical protein [Saccharophagus degradans]